MGALAPVALAVQTVGTLVQAGAERDAAFRAAEVQGENGRLAVLAGEQEADAIFRKERWEAGASLAAQGGSGLAFGGSIATLVEQSAFQAELDAARLRQQAFGEASNYAAQAEDSVRAGKNALVAGMFKAVAGAIDGVDAIRQQRLMSAQTKRERKATLGNTMGLG